jgi:hypothetical protein
MRVKTHELKGRALDYAVAYSQGHGGDFGIEGYHPSTDWAQGGPIIEREEIDVSCVNTGLWSATWWANNSGMIKNPAQKFKQNIRTDGPSPLIAAMRCYVLLKWNDQIEIPEEFA